jgi:hypothetical protein
VGREIEKKSDGDYHREPNEEALVAVALRVVWDRPWRSARSHQNRDEGLRRIGGMRPIITVEHVTSARLAGRESRRVEESR